MGRSCFPRTLLASLLLLSTFSHGFGRNLMEKTVHYEDSPGPVEGNSGVSRMMIELMDYAPPEANKNPRSDFLLTPPPQPQG